MATTLTQARTAVAAILVADTTFMSLVTDVCADVAPQTALPDYCILAWQSPGTDVLGAFGTRVMSRPTLKVAICGPQSHKPNIEAAYARADALLCPNGQPTRNSGGTLAIYRLEPLSLLDPELVDSEQWVQFGGLYRVEL